MRHILSSRDDEPFADLESAVRLSLRNAKVSTPKPSTGPDDGRGRASIALLVIRYATARRPEAATEDRP